MTDGVPKTPPAAAPPPDRVPKTPPDPGLPAGACDVLIVDDMATLRLTLARQVRLLGHRASMAQDGRDALAKLANGHIDLVLLDVMMPGMDGYAVLTQIKADPALCQIPVIMISGVDDLSSVVRCIEAGAEDYLPKPFEPSLLQARVRACLEKKQLWDELDNRYRQLQRLEQIREDLTHMLVHDLRTPLTSLLVGLQTLETAGELNALQRECLAIGIEGGQILQGQINDVLDVCKQEAGLLTLNCTAVAVPALIALCLGQVTALAQEKRLVVRTEVPATPLPLVADEDKLRRALVNLLGNAIKFTAAGGAITLRVRRSAAEQSLEFSIQDTGEGIPAKDFARIFEKFGQVKTSQANRKMSTGLGLTFCKMVAEAHGGRISVESEPGHGAHFHLSLPVAGPSGKNP